MTLSFRFCFFNSRDFISSFLERIFSISTKGEKPKWHFTADSDFEQAIKEGWLTNKDGSTLLPWQITELESEFKRASDRFKGLEVTSTKLNDK